MTLTETLRKTARELRGVESPLLTRLEQRLLDSRTARVSSESPLIAIVGPPRVGSTLMYQLLAASFDTNYFTNFDHALVRYPALARMLSRHLPKPEKDLASDHGFSGGFAGLSEANYFWPMWLGMGMSGPEPVSARRMSHGLAYFDLRYAEHQAPFLSSYNAHALSMPELSSAFPRLVVVAMTRDPVANALSILRARRQVVKDEEQWWSVRPPGLPDGLTPHEQIAWQVSETHRRMVAACQLMSEGSVVTVDYAELTSDPLVPLARVVTAAERMGIHMVAQGTVPLDGVRSETSRPTGPDTDLFVQAFSEQPSIG